MRTITNARLSRRQVLLSSAAAFIAVATGRANATIIRGAAPFKPFDYNPPETLGPGGWYFFTPDEAATVEALVSRIIPADELSVSGKDAGCAVFIDRQLAGSYGTSERLYMKGPFLQGTPEQGDQSELAPRQRYRIGIAALNAYCRSTVGKGFVELPGEQQDKTISGIESGEIALDGIDSKMFFGQLLANTMEGFFADPIYGGNRDMVSWKMIGFPGARYDYRDYVERHNEKFDLPPLSIAGRPEWTARN
ncbi:gluconate 2-dehydrogenase subunit 3 family protein [Rhizobium sp. P28RR-XV]|uniref:gluconate 2-dehydrogenase subunit 3 family protein n=1 Tax=Rhizobium sp. P28RR-XV TaxID=2726737 RepID=UPI0014563621|nr:gluconate 2-dehydrogenase subunit 3 family protein [Rhizobium sp. P28RR-XV]NLR88377.1 gluconate 2-dehydrogenase subunit 3 family protein [Rhizobium sp. P28RR-XV]